ncbi:MAG: hypothetical protein ACRCST_04350 [Turicibacter sp.]
MITLTELIYMSDQTPWNNSYQGADKKVLFVCSAGILRSATAARIYANQFNTRCAGTHEYALIPLSTQLLVWADEIVFVHKENHNKFKEHKLYSDELENKITILNIPDRYPHMASELIKLFSEQYKAVDK